MRNIDTMARTRTQNLERAAEDGKTTRKPERFSAIQKTTGLRMIELW